MEQSKLTGTIKIHGLADISISIHIYLSTLNETRSNSSWQNNYIGRSRISSKEINLEHHHKVTGKHRHKQKEKRRRRDAEKLHCNSILFEQIRPIFKDTDKIIVGSGGNNLNRSIFSKVKDEVPTTQKSHVVYNIPCSCELCYVGETIQHRNKEWVSQCTM